MESVNRMIESTQPSESPFPKRPLQTCHVMFAVSLEKNCAWAENI